MHRNLSAYALPKSANRNILNPIFRSKNKIKRKKKKGKRLKKVKFGGREILNPSSLCALSLSLCSVFVCVFLLFSLSSLFLSLSLSYICVFHKRIQAEITRNGLLQKNTSVGSTFVNVYAKVGHFPKREMCSIRFV